MGNLSVITTYRCNLTCDYCYNETHDGAAVGYRSRLERDFDEELIKRCVETLSHRNYGSLILTGGEPFLAKCTPMWIKNGCEHRLAVRIISNASVPYDTIFESIRDRAGVTLSISVGGDNAAVHDAHRGQWERTIGNVRRLREEDADIELSYVLSSNNLDRLDKVEELGLSLGTPVRLAAISLGRSMDSLASLSLRTVRPQQWDEAISRCRSPRLLADLATIRAFYQGSLRVHSCKMRTQSQVLDPAGDLFGCFFRPDIRWGNVFEHPLSEILDRIDRQAIWSAECFGEHCLTMLYH
jgi:sulfatase maturation enzyme AslB (radical SAM superfamily)